MGIQLFDFISCLLHCVITNFIYCSDSIRREGHFLVPPGKIKIKKKEFVAKTSFLWLTNLE